MSRPPLSHILPPVSGFWTVVLYTVRLTVHRPRRGKKKLGTATEFASHNANNNYAYPFRVRYAAQTAPHAGI